jgi:hypothetical protein
MLHQQMPSAAHSDICLEEDIKVKQIIAFFEIRPEFMTAVLVD